MNEWKNIDEVAPGRKAVCDFLISGTEDEPEVWILCSATYADLLVDFDIGKEPVVFWRLAQSLPAGVKKWTEEG